MKKPNAGDVYYFIQRNINRCLNEAHINNCSKLIDSARTQGYAFVDNLCDQLQWKRVELIVNHYPVTE